MLFTVLLGNSRTLASAVRIFKLFHKSTDGGFYFFPNDTSYGRHNLQKTAERGPRRGGQPSAGAPPGFPAAGEASHREPVVLVLVVPGGGSVFMTEGEIFFATDEKMQNT